MSEQKTITKKKKKLVTQKEYNYEETAERLNSMIEDYERTEKETVLEIWKEYQNAPDISKLFFNENGEKRLIWGQTKCYDMFDKYELKRKFPTISKANIESSAEKKVEQLIKVFDDDEQTNSEFVEQLQNEPAVKVIASDDYRIYESTMSLIGKVYKVTRSDFEVSHNYKMKLIEELKRGIRHLEQILSGVEGEYESP